MAEKNITINQFAKMIKKSFDSVDKKLEHFATKEELKKIASKEDIKNLNKKLDSISEDLKKVIN